MRSRAIFLVGGLVVAALLGGAVAGSVAAATSTTVTWKVSSLPAGQVISLSAVVTSNSPGAKTWSKTGSCALSPMSKPTKLTMGSTGSCVLTLKIAKSGNYLAKTSSKTITRGSTTTTVAPKTTTTTVAPTTTTTTVASTTTTTTVALTCATGGSCAVGDTGPGGGTVFYDAGSTQSWGRFLEMACPGWSDGTCGGNDLTDPRAKWGCSTISISGAMATAIGTGEENTAAIVAGCATAGIAAKVANDANVGGQTDWFLPSKDEVSEMYWQIWHARGGYATSYLWTSSQFYNLKYAAWVQAPYGGARGDQEKTRSYFVRPVRAF